MYLRYSKYFSLNYSTFPDPPKLRADHDGKLGSHWLYYTCLIHSIFSYLRPAMFDDWSPEVRVPLEGHTMIFEKSHCCLYLLEGDNTTVIRWKINRISGNRDAPWLKIELISTLQDIMGLNIGPDPGQYLPNFLCIQKFPTGNLVDQLFELDLPLIQFYWLGSISDLG